MRITKRGKKVDITFVEVIKEYSKYVCPSYKTSFVGGGPSRTVIRFWCKCGQELIVDKILNE